MFAALFVPLAGQAGDDDARLERARPQPPAAPAFRSDRDAGDGSGYAVSALTRGAAELGDAERESWKADRVLILKGERRLLLLSRDRIVAEYRVALGREPIGHKTREGDGRTPEGHYLLDWRHSNSAFYRSIHISYPDEDALEYARTLGVSAGGAIMIHGFPNHMKGYEPRHWRADWTDGCIAVTNREMDEIWERVDDGTPIEIRP